MKFQKGSKVEVMNKTELPTSWCIARVVSGNRHTYNLKYDCYPGVEKVSREFIRPCPPARLQRWVAGDIVEVFDNNSWKTATVCSVSDGGHFSLRPHGFSHEIHVYKSNIRMRQSWQDGKWVPIVKISGSYGDVKVSQMAEPIYHESDLQIPLADAKIREENDNCLVGYNDVGLQESRIVFSKTLKRASPFCSSHLEASPGNAKKSKTAETLRRRRLVPNQSLEKVDAFAFPQDENIQASFYNTVNGFNELEKGKLNGTRISEPSDSENDQCSVGSCSVSSNGTNKWSSPYLAVTHQEADIFSSNAESYNASSDNEGNHSPSSEEGVTANLHRLELNAYRSTLEALYASGPLSWEKEALLTNLRINLHISNDEHLTELKHLISAGNSFLD